MTTYLDRLNEEINSLSDRLKNLTAFIQTDVFNNLEINNKRLFEAQKKAMEDYLNILQLRIKQSEGL